MTRILAVIGMHRSGTSCLTGCLEDMGLALGEVNRAAPYNRKGNNENETLRDLQDRILARVGCDWLNPPLETIKWTLDEVRSANAVLTVPQNLPVWGFKDPRTLLLLDGWLDIRPDMEFVATIRHPLEVAASLSSRNGFPTATSISLWVAYNQALLDLRRTRDFPIVLYDHDSGRYINEVRAAGRVLGLSHEAPIKFRDEELNHHAVSEEPPAETRAIWHGLNAYRYLAYR